jgi:polysaccharide export outer membrane protein
MMRQHIKILIGLFIFLFYIFTNLAAEDRYRVPHSPGSETRYSTTETTQHYLNGKEFYSQGRYDEARNEFEKALESINPPEIGVMTKETAQEKTLEIVPPQTPALKAKAVKKKTEEKKAEGKGTELTKAVVKPAPKVEEAQGEREYYIDIGDILDISVWQIADLSRPEVIVRPDGRISMPLIGDIKAEGISLTQLDNIITEKFKTYVKNPEVSVMIRRFGEQTNKVVILGEVPSPGVYRFGGPPTISEVVASAGGYTKYAVLNSIMIIRGDVRAKPEVTRVNLAQVLKSGRLSENIVLKPNDIVYVPRSFVGKVNVFLELIQPAVSEYMQTMDARHFHNVMHRAE